MLCCWWFGVGCSDGVFTGVVLLQFGVGCSGGVFTGVVLLTVVWCRLQWWSVYRCCVVGGLV